MQSTGKNKLFASVAAHASERGLSVTGCFKGFSSGEIVRFNITDNAFDVRVRKPLLRCPIA